MNAVVSIVIPTFNREKLLDETLTSIKNQSYTHWECLIIDDHSTDASVAVIQEFVDDDARFQLFIRPENKPKGANSCRNFGIEKASGTYLMFFDSDDLLKENCLENRVSEFHVNENRDMLVFSMGIFDYQTPPKIYEKRKSINLTIKDSINEFIFSNTLPWNVCRPIYKTSFIKGKIAFNETIHNFQDDEFNLRVLYYLQPNYLSIDYTDCYYRFDTESINKYNNPIGFQNQINSLYEYYSTVFTALGKKQKFLFREKLAQKLYNQIKSFVRPNLKMKPLYKTIKLFKSELKLSLSESFALYAIAFLNRYFFTTKGYHFLSLQTKKILWNANDRNIQN